MKDWHRGLLWGLSSWLLVALTAFWLPAIANMANPDRAGDWVGEPWTQVADLDILHEALTIDLRPLATQDPAVIQVAYTVDNPGPEASVALLFAAPGLATGTITLDGDRRIEAMATDAPSIPDEWQQPRVASPMAGLEFTIPLSAGTHTIAIDYTAHPSSTDQGVYRSYTLDYWLAPAAQWRSFGTLELDVYSPQGWGTDWSLELPQAAEGYWHQKFAGLPADVLTLSTYPTPPGWVRLLRRLIPLSSWGVAIAGVWWSCRWLGRTARHRQWQQGWLVLTVILLVPACVLAFWGLIGLGLWLAEALLDNRHLAVGYAYGRFWLFAAIGLLAGAIGPVIGIIAYARGYRRSQPSP